MHHTLGTEFHCKHPLPCYHTMPTMPSTPAGEFKLNTLNLILLLALSLDCMHVSNWMKQDCKNSKYQASINENSLATSITWYPNFQVLKLCLLCTYYVMKRSTDYRKPSSTNQQRQKSYLKMGPKAHSRRQKSTSLDQSVISGHQKCMLAWRDIRHILMWSVSDFISQTCFLLPSVI